LPEGIEVTFAAAEEGGTAPARQAYDLVLAGMGRSTERQEDRREKAGVAVTDRGFINVDIQMRTNVPHIFAIGDIVGQPMLARKAVHEAHVAAEAIAGELQGDKEFVVRRSTPQSSIRGLHRPRGVAWVGLSGRPGGRPKASRSRRACSLGRHRAATKASAELPV